MKEPKTFFEASMACIQLTAYMNRRRQIVEVLTKATVLCNIAVFPMLILCFFLNKESTATLVFIIASVLVAIWAMVGRTISAKYGMSVLVHGLRMEYIFTLRNDLLIESLEALIIEGLNDEVVTIYDSKDTIVGKLGLLEMIPDDAIETSINNVIKYTDDERKEKLQSVLPRVKRELFLFKKR